MWGVFSARGYLLAHSRTRLRLAGPADAWPQAAAVSFLGAIGLDR